MATSLPPLGSAAPAANQGRRFPLQEPRKAGERQQSPKPQRDSAVDQGVAAFVDAMAGGRMQDVIMAAVQKTNADFMQRRQLWEEDERRRFEVQYVQQEENNRTADAQNLQREGMEVNAEQGEKSLNLQERSVASQEKAADSNIKLDEQNITESNARIRLAELESKRQDIEAKYRLKMIDEQTRASMMQETLARIQAVNTAMAGAAAIQGGIGGGIEMSSNGKARIDTSGDGSGTGGVKFQAQEGDILPTDPEAHEARDLSMKIEQARLARDAAVAANDKPLAAEQKAEYDRLSAQYENLRTQAISGRQNAQLRAQYGDVDPTAVAPVGSVRALSELYYPGDPAAQKLFLDAVGAAAPDPLTGRVGNPYEFAAYVDALQEQHPETYGQLGDLYVKAVMRTNPGTSLEQAREFWTQWTAGTSPLEDLPHIEDMRFELEQFKAGRRGRVGPEQPMAPRGTVVAGKAIGAVGGAVRARFTGEGPGGKLRSPAGHIVRGAVKGARWGAKKAGGYLSEPVPVAGDE